MDNWEERCNAAEATLASCNRARQAAEAECKRLREQVATLAALLDKAAALYADEWPSYFEDEVSAALEATA